MDIADTKTDRLEFGAMLESAVKAMLLKHNFETTRPEWTPYEDLKYGDLMAKRPNGEVIKIDCKRGRSLSLKSVDNYEGEYYLFSWKGSLDPNNWWVVPAGIVKAYAATARKDATTLPSGEPGVKLALSGLRTKIWFFDWLDNGLTF